jgi:hypothetical protein
MHNIENIAYAINNIFAHPARNSGSWTLKLGMQVERLSSCFGSLMTLVLGHFP